VNDIGTDVAGHGESSSAAQMVVDEIVAAGGQAIADSHSVAIPEGGAAIVDTALREYGRVDVVVNNAGILRDKGFHNMTADLVAPVIDVHLLGAFNVTRPAWQHMRERGSGVVVNTTSSAGLLGNAGQANYAAAKMGLVGFTRTLAVEGGRSGIRVVAIAPLARTRMTEEAMGDFAAEVDPRYASALLTVLAHPSCTRTGEIYSVGGGRIARFVVSLTDGWFDPASALVPERIAERIDAIGDESATIELRDAIDEIRLVRRLVYGR
jgi:NAD(P)-dependent dehydrogenase (short-subunit alcohol dehydrogenase family)